MIKKIRKHKNLLLVAFCVTIISFIPYMNDYLLFGHDVTFHLGRIEGLAEAISSFDFLGRLNLINGFGYASGIMYPQLFLYIPAILRVLGLSLVNSYKIFIFIIGLVNFFVSYISFRQMLRLKEDYIAILASAFYTLGVYRMINIYIRAALGEVLGMAFLPLLLWGMYELFEGDYKRWWIAVIGWTCVIQSHILTVEIALAFSVLFFVIRFKVVFCRARVEAIFKAVILVALLNAFFIVPFIHYYSVCDFQIHHISSDTNIPGTAVHLSQMFSSTFRNSAELAEMGVLVGKSQASIGVISLITLFVYAILRINTHNRYFKMGDLMFFITVLILFAVSDLFPWGGLLYRFPLINNLIASIQFLWRLFGYAYLFLTIIFIIDIYVLKDSFKKPAIIVVAMFLILQSSWHYIEGIVPDREVLSVGSRELNVDELYLYNDYSSWTELFVRGEEVQVTAPEGDWCISNYYKCRSEVSFHVELGSNDVIDIEIPLYYYPTYIAQLNGEQLEYEPGGGMA